MCPHSHKLLSGVGSWAEFVTTVCRTSVSRRGRPAWAKWIFCTLTKYQVRLSNCVIIGKVTWGPVPSIGGFDLPFLEFTFIFWTLGSPWRICGQGVQGWKVVFRKTFKPEDQGHQLTRCLSGHGMKLKQSQSVGWERVGMLWGALEKEGCSLCPETAGHVGLDNKYFRGNFGLMLVWISFHD